MQGVLLIVLVHLAGAAPIYLGAGVPAAKDLVVSFQPMQATLARQGWPPWRTWEPRGGLGTPMHAESQASQLYPPAAASRLLLDPDLGLFPLIYLHFPASGIFMLLLARELGLEPAAACLSGLAWMGSGFMVTHLDIPPMLYEATWLPAAAAGLMRHFRTGRWLPLGMAGVAVGLMLLGGHFQVALYGCGLLTAWSWFARPEADVRRRTKNVALAASAIALGIAFAWAQVEPTIGLLARSNRAEQGGGLWVSWSPHQWAAAFQPFLFGLAPRPMLAGDLPDSVSTYWGAGVYWETALYIGLVPLLLALLFARPRWQAASGFLWAATGISLLLAAGKHVPGAKLLWSLPLWGAFRFPSRILVVTHFCLALLAGFGAERLRALGLDDLGRSARRLFWIVPAFLLGITLAWWGATGRAAETLHPLAGANLRVLLWIGLLACALAAAARCGRARTLLPWGVALIAGIDLCTYFVAQRWLVSPDFYRGVPPSPIVCNGDPDERYFSVARYQAHPGDRQLDLLPASLNLRTPCATVDFYGSLYDRRFARFLGALLAGYTAPDGRVLPRPSRLPLFALAGVHEFVRRESMEGPEFERSSGEGRTIKYRFDQALPPLRRVSCARFVDGEEAAWRAVNDADFDPRSEIVLEGRGLDKQSDATGAIEVVSRGPTHLELATHGSQSAWIVWSEMWSPGWSASVDGSRREILHANYLFQAVAVGAGETRVRFDHNEPGLARGAMSAALVVGACVGFGWRDRKRCRAAVRQPPGPGERGVES